MGTRDAPRLFTTIIRAVLRFLRSKNIRVFPYLDDTLILGSSYQEYLRAVKFVGLVFEALGFFIHPKKSELVPTQMIKFLGFKIHTVLQEISLPAENCTKLRREIRFVKHLFEKGTSLSFRRFPSFVGFIISCTPAIPYSNAHFRSFERVKETFFRPIKDWDSTFTLTDFIVEDLECSLSDCWRKEKSFKPHIPNFHVYTDTSSKRGLGATCRSQKVGVF